MGKKIIIAPISGAGIMAACTLAIVKEMSASSILLVGPKDLAKLQIEDCEVIYAVDLGLKNCQESAIRKLLTEEPRIKLWIHAHPDGANLTHLMPETVKEYYGEALSQILSTAGLIVKKFPIKESKRLTEIVATADYLQNPILYAQKYGADTPELAKRFHFAMHVARINNTDEETVNRTRKLFIDELVDGKKDSLIDKLILAHEPVITRTNSAIALLRPMKDIGMIAFTSADGLIDRNEVANHALHNGHTFKALIVQHQDFAGEEITSLFEARDSGLDILSKIRKAKIFPNFQINGHGAAIPGPHAETLSQLHDHLVNLMTK